MSGVRGAKNSRDSPEMADAKAIAKIETVMAERYAWEGGVAEYRQMFGLPGVGITTVRRIGTKMRRLGWGYQGRGNSVADYTVRITNPGDRKWMRDALCLGDLRWAEAETYRERKQLAQLCITACPVLAECRRWAANKPWVQVAVGGWVAPLYRPEKPPWSREGI